ncbi:MAG: 30S ribosomal protein S8 [Actinobacteria bacterium]|nr:30S ribosomal protein S8 [Actinomycetota bacterium]MCL5770842.1 30S ribosomal protein S8 [Actinomycetota bacterium]
MVVTDPIADMLTRIRNANKAKLDFVDIPYSRIKKDIAKILLEKGYIRNFELTSDSIIKSIRIYLKFDKNKNSVITGIKRISKPGLRTYAKNNEIPKVLGGIGTVIISTSKGVLTGSEAKKNGLGGEIICYIW